MNISRWDAAVLTRIEREHRNKALGLYCAGEGAVTVRNFKYRGIED